MAQPNPILCSKAERKIMDVLNNLSLSEVLGDHIQIFHFTGDPIPSLAESEVYLIDRKVVETLIKIFAEQQKEKQ